jgi:phytol kinase
MPPEGIWRVLVGMAIVAVAYGALFGTGELLRRFGLSGEVTRSAVHVGSSLVALGLPVVFASPVPVVGMAVGFAAVMLVSERVGLLGSIHDIPRRTVGASAYPLGIAAAFTLTGGVSPAYPIAVLALGLADPAASFAGRRATRRQVEIWGTTRTLGGSAAAFVTATVTTATVLAIAVDPGTPSLVATSLAVGLAVAVAEAASPRGLDNVAIPVMAGAVGGADPAWWIAILLVALGVFAVAGTAVPAARANAIGTGAPGAGGPRAPSPADGDGLVL